MSISFKTLAVTAVSALAISVPLAASAMEVGANSGVTTTTITGTITETSNTSLTLGHGSISAGSINGSLTGEGGIALGGTLGDSSLDGNGNGGASGQFSLSGEYETENITGGFMNSSSNMSGNYLSNSTTFTSSVFNNF